MEYVPLCTARDVSLDYGDKSLESLGAQESGDMLLDAGDQLRRFLAADDGGVYRRPGRGPWRGQNLNDSSGGMTLAKSFCQGPACVTREGTTEDQDVEVFRLNQLSSLFQ